MRSIAIVVMLAGCNLYLAGSHESPDACVQQGSGSGPASLIDPSTGQCTTIQGWPCSTAFPEWPACSGPCNGLDEPSCLATAQCHAAYIDTTGGSGSATRAYSACWNMIATQPNPNGACAGLDAETCALQHQCASLMLIATDVEHFESCFAASGAGGGCTDPGICYGSVQCNDAPPACPVGTVAGIANGCWSGYCIPTTKCPD